LSGTKAQRHKGNVLSYFSSCLGDLVARLKMNYKPLSKREESIAEKIVDAAYNVHKILGPGLLEKVYEVCFCHELSKRK